MKTIIIYALILSSIALHSFNAAAQAHGHLNVGAIGTNQNDKLFFANGGEFVDSSGYVKTLTFTNGGRFAGYHEGNITLTVLPATAEHSGPDPAAPAFGSFIQFSISCLSGPANGAFGFWDTGSTVPTDSVRPGERSTNLFRLTEADGSPDLDPYGHIHGRRFSATVPGIYTIAFQAFDTSTNGANGGPIHRPSDVFPMIFQAGINIASITQTGLVASVRYGSTANQIFTLEYTTNLAQPIFWLPVAGPKIGNDYFQGLEDPATVDAQRFYRIRADQYIP
ncbi:MAG TPA: hypothetical protein VJ063_13970 [Verrucomicrobiae bacterium]|nr:hypothetical protein [Verrucomicrobiae bacterium]